MPKFHSIRDKLMVSTFLLILLCGLVVIYLCGRQMEDLFLRYLSMPGTMHGGMMHGGMMGGGMGMMGLRNWPLWNPTTSPFGGWGCFCFSGPGGQLFSGWLHYQAPAAALPGYGKNPPGQAEAGSAGDHL